MHGKYIMLPHTVLQHVEGEGNNSHASERKGHHFQAWQSVLDVGPSYHYLLSQLGEHSACK